MNKSTWKSFQILILSAVCLLITGCAQVPLYTNLPEKEINEIMAILLSRDIACDKIIGTDGAWSISVEKDKMSEAVEVLNRFGFPRDDFETVGKVFKKSGLVSSPSEERIRFMYALSQEVALTISKIDGVLTARVHIVLQNNDPLSETITPSSAAVFVKYRKGSGVGSLSSQIKKLVTNSIEGLVYEKVSVVFFPASLSDINTSNFEGALQLESPQDVRFLLMAAMGALLLLVVAGAAFYWYQQNKKADGTTTKGGEA